MDIINEQLPDLVAIVVFLIFAVAGGRRGLYDSLMGVVVTLAAVVGALLLTPLLADTVTDWVFPGVRERFVGTVDLGGVVSGTLGGVTAQIEAALPPGFLNLTRKLGLDPGAFVTTAAGGAVIADAQRAAASAVESLLYSVVSSLARIVLFFLLLFVLRLVLNALKNALGLAFRLPVIHWIDRVGGVALGIIECAILLYLLLWIFDLFQVEAVVDFARRSWILSLLLGT